MPQSHHHLQELDKLEKHVDYPKYLAYMLGSTSDVSQHTAAVCGFTLNSWIQQWYGSLPEQHQAVVQELLLPPIISASQDVRNAATAACATIVRQVGLPRWPRLVAQMIAAVASETDAPAAGGLRLFSLLAQDSPSDLMAREFAADPPLSKLVPAAVAYMQSSSVSHAVYATEALMQLISVMPGAMVTNMSSYLPALGKVTATKHPRLLPLACRSFVEMTQHALSALAPHIDEVIELMLGCMDSSYGEDVQKEAVEFWSTFVESVAHVNDADWRLKLVSLFPRLLPALLNCCCFGEMELVDLPCDNTRDVDEADRPQDVAPHLFKEKGSTMQVKVDIAGGEINDDSQESVQAQLPQGQWTLRRAAVGAVDDLATFYGEMMWAELWPLLRGLLTADETSDQMAWQKKEIGIMVLGAIADGLGETVVTEHFDELLPFLLACCANEHPLVRSTAVWTIKVYGEWIVHGIADDDKTASVLRAVLPLVNDPVKRVVTGALSSLSSLFLVMQEQLEPHADEVLQLLMAKLPVYQLANARHLYDSLASLFEAMAPVESLNTEQHAKLCLQPLLAQYETMPIDDLRFIMLSECVAHCVSAVGPASAPYAAGLWHRAACLVQALMLEYRSQAEAAPNAPVDRTPLSVNLDILDHITIANGAEVAPLLGGGRAVVAGQQVEVPSLLALLQPCLSDPSRRVRVAGFAVVCDLLDAGVPGFVTHDTLQPLMELMLQSAKVVTQQQQPGSAAPPTIVRKPLNNAIWSMVELARAIKGDFKPYVPHVLEVCAGVFKHMKRVERTCLCSASTLLAQCANLAASVVVPHLHELLHGWLQATAVNSDQDEKGEIQDVFIALYSSTVAKQLFDEAPEAVVFFACSWWYPTGNKPPQDKHQALLQWVQQIAGAQPNGWPAAVQSFDMSMQRALGLNLPELAPPGLAAAAAAAASNSRAIRTSSGVLG